MDADQEHLRDSNEGGPVTTYSFVLSVLDMFEEDEGVSPFDPIEELRDAMRVSVDYDDEDDDEVEERAWQLEYLGHIGDLVASEVPHALTFVEERQENGTWIGVVLLQLFDKEDADEQSEESDEPYIIGPVDVHRALRIYHSE